MDGFPAGGAVFRGDLNAFVEQAMDVDTQFFAEQVCPPVAVKLKEGQYPVLKVADFNLQSVFNTPRQPGTAYPEGSSSVDRDTYACQDWGLTQFVDDSLEAYFERYDLSLEAKATMVTARNLRYGYEQRVANLFFNTSNFTTTNVTSSYLTANLATVNPVQDIENAIYQVAAQGTQPDTIIMSFPVFSYITRSTLFQNYVKPYGVAVAGQISDMNIIKKAFEGMGISNVYISYLNYNSSDKPNTVSLSQVWSNSYFWVGRKGTGNLGGGGPTGAACAFFWEQQGSFYTTENWYDYVRRGNYVRVRMYETEKLLDATNGYLVTTGYTGG